METVACVSFELPICSSIIVRQSRMIQGDIADNHLKIFDDASHVDYSQVYT